MKLAIAALAAASVALAASAQPAQPVSGVDAAAHATLFNGQCFNTRDIANHTVGAKDLYVNVTGRGVYRLTMSNACLAGSMSSDPIILHTSTGSGLICKPIDLDLAMSHGKGFHTPCIVSSIALLAPAEVAALPKSLRP